MDLSTHGFWLGNILIMIFETVSSTSFPVNPTTSSVNRLMSLSELSWNMSQSVVSRASCRVASDWSVQRVTSLCTRASCFSRCLYFGARKMTVWSD